MALASLDVWERAAVALDEWSCNYLVGRGKDDPVYIEVTEGRDGPGAAQRKTYSSCADRCHWKLWRLGLREPWINRKANGGWRVGQNISLLSWQPKSGIWHVPYIVPDADWIPGPGDELVIWRNGNDAHSLSALGPPEKGKLTTANYGAGGMSPGSWPGARIGSAPLALIGGQWYYGQRIVHRVIPVSAMRNLSRVPVDMTGAAMTGEDLDALDGLLK
jgi:hypothetical protein